MPEVKDVSESTEDKSDVQLAMEESESPEESSPEQADGQETTGEVEKTKAEDGSSEDSEPDDEDVPEGQAIPYDRFKKVNSQKKEFMTKAERLEAEVKEFRSILSNPTVMREALKARGYSDEKIAEVMQKEGVQEPKNEDQMVAKLAEGLDLTKQEGWIKLMMRISEEQAKKALTPLQQAQRDRETREQITGWETEAKTLAKDVYGIEYDTATKHMEKYLAKHPEDAALGHPKILKLAMSEFGMKIGEQKGQQKEKERLKALKASAMEGDGQVGRSASEEPDASASIHEIMEFARKTIK